MVVKLLFCTSNENKRREVEAILNAGTEAKFEVTSLNLEMPELQGTLATIAQTKCKWAYQELERSGRLPEKTWIMAEDTGLAFDALNGLPGPYIKWFLEAVKNEGLPRLLDGFHNYGASAQDAIAIYDGSTADPLVFVGEIHGTIVDPRGPSNFGWDPNFLPDGESGTYAELPHSRKSEISHRRRALDMLRAHFS
eukprot:Gregarina_sp_Pseudo_9__289@NODE_1187_length_1804_cov_7_835694_g1113_i0_p2_GENE_NODE_1187_length_1804_cov_7_835694_g1113_i0NODE_1187_length_1804_cov_7_835694_g1113_i0_p2_ORF_typecomplete_len195_score16_26Ham1p_like/PF01725_16/4_9e55_NODE_1187_length_1804_cov_7_835694_g1113_i011211705